MELLIDIIVEGFLWIVAEGMIELFVSMAFLFIPEKNRSIKAEIAARIVGAIVGVIILILGAVGVFMLIFSGATSIVGWIFISVSAAFVITSIIFAIVGKAKKKNKEEK